jgi:hypothetical protein
MKKAGWNHRPGGWSGGRTTTLVRDQLKWAPVKRPITHYTIESITFRQF